MTNLTGSEKQIKWAEDIINGAYKTIEINVEHAKNYMAPKMPEYAEQQLKGWEIIKDALDKAFATYTKASEIIDNRKDFSDKAILYKHNMIVNRM